MTCRRGFLVSMILGWQLSVQVFVRSKHIYWPSSWKCRTNWVVKTFIYISENTHYLWSFGWKKEIQDARYYLMVSLGLQQDISWSEHVQPLVHWDIGVTDVKCKCISSKSVSMPCRFALIMMNSHLFAVSHSAKSNFRTNNGHLNWVSFLGPTLRHNFRLV